MSNFRFFIFVARLRGGIILERISPINLNRVGRLPLELGKSAVDAFNLFFRSQSWLEQSRRDFEHRKAEEGAKIANLAVQSGVIVRTPIDYPLSPFGDTRNKFNNRVNRLRRSQIDAAHIRLAEDIADIGGTDEEGRVVKKMVNEEDGSVQYFPVDDETLAGINYVLERTLEQLPE